jgi:hypothetical protein
LEMALYPVGSDLIHDPQFDELLDMIGKSPHMFVQPPTLGGIIAYIDGFNRGRGGSPLLGFREWLVLRVRSWNNLLWPGLACIEICGDRLAATKRGDEPALMEALVKLVQEFIAYRKENGLSKVFWDFAEWLRRQEWYSGPLPVIPPEGP